MGPGSGDWICLSKFHILSQARPLSDVLIGTGLFISSGSALNLGGPATLLLAYLMVGAMLYFVMQALGELAVVFPIAGSFSAYSTRFLDPAWGFAMGWK